MKSFKFTVTVEVERESGKFMARADIIDAVREEIEGADPGEVSGGPDGDSVYSITGWDVTDVDD